MESGDWLGARRSFEAVLAREEVPEALLGLGDALWWLGETDLAVRLTERAYAAFRRRPDPATAAFAAIGLYFVYRISLGNVAASRGWLGRAASLVEEFGLTPLYGWILLVRAHDTSDAAAAAAWAREARELARSSDDADLELCATSELGAALVEMGMVDEGVALLDEAMAGSLAGEGGRLDTVVYTSCSMITSCTQIAEMERAAQWIRAADDFTQRYGSPHLYTLCRTYYGSLLFATGRWKEAEEELHAALNMGRTAERALYGEALARLAELRIAQGRIEEAAQLIPGFEEDAAMGTVVGALHLAAGNPAVAASVLRRRLRDPGKPSSFVSGYQARAAFTLEQAAMLELLVEAELERGDLAAAMAEARRLVELGARLGWDVVIATSERALGRALLAKGDREGGKAHIEHALTLFARLTMPYEAARAHLLLAMSEDERETAVAEARAALVAFEHLGAGGAADRAAAVLRSLGEKAARAGPRSTGILSKRELEVLRLLGEGLSNRQIADRLYLTVKTVEHHVRSIFTKLDLSNRAEAAAYAVRHL